MTSTLTEKLGRFARVGLLDGPTPIQRLERLERALGLDVGPFAYRPVFEA